MPRRWYVTGERGDATRDGVAVATIVECGQLHENGFASLGGSKKTVEGPATNVIPKCTEDCTYSLTLENPEGQWTPTRTRCIVQRKQIPEGEQISTRLNV